MTLASSLWGYDTIQFPRLLTEIDASMDPELSLDQLATSAHATKLSVSQVDPIFRKADAVWTSIIKRSSSLYKKRWFDPESVRTYPAFARLLTGIYQTGLATEQWHSLMESMDLTRDQLKELFLRAADAYMRDLEV